MVLDPNHLMTTIVYNTMWGIYEYLRVYLSMIKDFLGGMLRIQWGKLEHDGYTEVYRDILGCIGYDRILPPKRQNSLYEYPMHTSAF